MVPAIAGAAEPPKPPVRPAPLLPVTQQALPEVQPAAGAPVQAAAQPPAQAAAPEAIQPAAQGAAQPTTIAPAQVPKREVAQATAKPPAPKPAAKPVSQVQTPGSRPATEPSPVKINADLEICQVSGDFATGDPPRSVKSLVYNPRNDLVYTPLTDAADPSIASRVVEGAVRDQVIRACNDYAEKNRNTPAAQAYLKSRSRAEIIRRAERSRAGGRSVPITEAISPAPPAPGMRIPSVPAGAPAGSRSDTGPSAAAARAAATSPGQDQPSAMPGQPARKYGADVRWTGSVGKDLEKLELMPGVVAPSTLTPQAESQLNERVRGAIEDALQRSPDVEVIRHQITAASHEYQAAVRDKTNPEMEFEIQGGMSYGRRGPALQNSDDTDPITGATSTQVNSGPRGFVRPGFQLSIPVYDAGEREAKKNFAGAGVEGTALAMDDQRAETASFVRDVFYQWRVSRAYIGLIQQWRPGFDEWIDKVKKLHRVQMVTDVDLSLALAVEEHFRQRMDAICLDLKYREQIWGYVVETAPLRQPTDLVPVWCTRPAGSTVMPLDATATVAGDITMSHWPLLPQYPTPAEIDLMAEKMPVVQLAAIEVKKQREKVVIAESQMMPRVFAEAHARQTMPGLDELTGDTDAFIGMRMTMPIFDNYVRSSKAQAQTATLAAAEMKVTAVRQKVRRDLSLLAAELDRLGNLQQGQFETVRAAAIRLRAAKLRFEEQGSKAAHELMLATLDYLRTFERSDDTIRQYYTSYNRLLRQVGTSTTTWRE